MESQSSIEAIPPDVKLPLSQTPSAPAQKLGRISTQAKILLFCGLTGSAILLFGFMIIKGYQLNRSPNIVFISPTPTAILTSPQESEESSFEANSRETIDDLFLKVALKYPGFGGMYIDDSNDLLYVYLKSGELDEVVTELHTVFGKDRLPQKAQVLQGTYGFLELKKWYDQFVPYALQIPGVITTDIDEAKNRINIGVESPEAKVAVEKKLTEFTIPKGAINIVQEGAIKFY